MLTRNVCCCSANRSVDSDESSTVQTLMLGSEGSAESAKTSAAADEEPQSLPDDGELAREAAYWMQCILEQVGHPPDNAIGNLHTFLSRPASEQHARQSSADKQQLQGLQNVYAATLVRCICALSPVVVQPTCA